MTVEEKVAVRLEELQNEERLRDTDYNETVFRGLLSYIHDLREQKISAFLLRQHSDVVQSRLKQEWPGDKKLKLFLPNDAVVLDHNYYVVSKGMGVFTADKFDGIDNVGARFLNLRDSQSVRFSNAEAAGFEFFDQNPGYFE